MVRFIIFACVMTFATASFADCNPISCSGVYVDMLYVKAEGEHRVATSGDERLLNCNAVSDVYVTLPKSENEDVLISTLMTAQATDRKVTVRIRENTNNCEVIYVKLVR